MLPDKFRYAPRYCEENVWYLCQDARFDGLRKLVVVISNERRACEFWRQRATKHRQQPIWWDYHVILLVENTTWMVWDLDTRCDFPAAASIYLDETFGQATSSDPFAPLFRLIDAEEYVQSFSSDRSHMRTADGEWLTDPPPWPPILRGGPPTFRELMTVLREGIANVLTLGEMRQRFVRVTQR